jgi:hypothetical protein
MAATATLATRDFIALLLAIAERPHIRPPRLRLGIEPHAFEVGENPLSFNDNLLKRMSILFIIKFGSPV